jgi:hypothetical protein
VDDDGLGQSHDPPRPINHGVATMKFSASCGESERPHHLARMSILERGPLNPFSFNEITSAITEFEDLDFRLAVLAIKFQCDPVFEPVESWRAA